MAGRSQLRDPKDAARQRQEILPVTGMPSDQSVQWNVSMSGIAKLVQCVATPSSGTALRTMLPSSKAQSSDRPDVVSSSGFIDSEG
jgi:hypothetical protein